MVVQQNKGVSWTTKRLSKRASQRDSYKEIGQNLERSYERSDVDTHRRLSDTFRRNNEKEPYKEKRRMNWYLSAWHNRKAREKENLSEGRIGRFGVFKLGDGQSVLHHHTNDPQEAHTKASWLSRVLQHPMYVIDNHSGHTTKYESGQGQYPINRTGKTLHEEDYSGWKSSNHYLAAKYHHNQYYIAQTKETAAFHDEEYQKHWALFIQKRSDENTTERIERQKMYIRESKLIDQLEKKAINPTKRYNIWHPKDSGISLKSNDGKEAWLYHHEDDRKELGILNQEDLNNPAERKHGVGFAGKTYKPKDKSANKDIKKRLKQHGFITEEEQTKPMIKTPKITNVYEAYAKIYKEGVLKETPKFSDGGKKMALGWGRDGYIDKERYATDDSKKTKALRDGRQKPSSQQMKEGFISRLGVPKRIIIPDRSRDEHEHEAKNSGIVARTRASYVNDEDDRQSWLTRHAIHRSIGEYQAGKAKRDISEVVAKYDELRKRK